MAGWDGCPGAGLIPRPELVPFPQRWAVGVETRASGGGREGSHPYPPAEPGQNQWQGSLGAAAVGDAHSGLARLPSGLAHSKVSHCFLSCSTEPGAGAGLTSCLVFCNKSSKGSLAC